MGQVTSFKTPNGEAMIVLSAADYERLCDLAELSEDIAAYDAAKRRLAVGEDEFVPAAIVDRILAGENRVRVWREHRGLTATALAEKAGVAQGYLSQVETGKREGTVATLRRIADGLGVTLDDLAG